MQSRQSQKPNHSITALTKTRSVRSHSQEIKPNHQYPDQDMMNAHPLTVFFRNLPQARAKLKLSLKETIAEIKTVLKPYFRAMAKNKMLSKNSLCAP
jgi:hypothetical protein